MGMGSVEPLAPCFETSRRENKARGADISGRFANTGML